MSRVDPSFWAGRRVLVTGHTGFKGAWAALWLARMGAHVTGLALPPETDPNLFGLADVKRDVSSLIADIRNPQEVAEAVALCDPEIVLHLAAQPLVRRAIALPVMTFATNVIGTVHLLDALRNRTSLRAVLIVTTDKVYENHENGLAFQETDPLGGHEPYGASKAAAEIATAAMARTYFENAKVPVATARGGNVIGGGDFSEDRLVPDIIRAVQNGTQLVLRNPSAIRPWQYVLDCLAGYFCFLQALTTKATSERTLNFGPEGGEVSVQMITSAICAALGAEAEWTHDPCDPHNEAHILKLDATRARISLGWRDWLPNHLGVDATASWYLAWKQGKDMRTTTITAIDEFMSLQRKVPLDTAAASGR